MIAKRAIGYLKSADYEVLKNCKSVFTWSANGKEEIDGPTILWILIHEVNPSTRVGLSEFKQQIWLVNSAMFQHNVKKLTNYVSSKYRAILDKGHKHDDNEFDLFNALETVPNPDFAAHI